MTDFLPTIARLGNLFGAQGKYILTLRTGPGAVAQRMVVLPHVQSVRVVRKDSTQFDWTASHVSRQHSGIRQHEILLTGRSGVGDVYGYTHTGTSTVRTGPEIFRELEKFMALYQHLVGNQTKSNFHPEIAVPTNLAAPYTLSLLMLHEDREWLVEPTAFAFDRKAESSRFSYEYSLSLIAYDNMAKKSTIVPSFLTAMRDIGNTLNNLAADITLMANQVDALRKTVGSEMHALMQSVVRLGNAVAVGGAAIGGVGRLASRNIVQELFFATQGLLQAATDTLDGLNFNDAWNDDIDRKFREWSGNVASLRRTCLGYLGMYNIRVDDKQSALDKSGGVAGPPEIAFEEGGLESAQTETVNDGESLFDFSLRVTGASNNWFLIAVLNNMQDQYTLVDGQPLVGGVELKIPTSGIPIAANDTTGVGGLLIDLKLQNGDLVPVGSDPQDVAITFGAENLKQAMMVRLLTEEGTHPVYPELGLPRLVGSKMTGEVIATALMGVRSELLSDRRVSAIENYDVEVVGDTLTVHATMSTTVGSKIDLSIPLEVT